MKSFGFTLFTLVLIALLAYGGYYALTRLTDPASYVSNDNVTLGDMHPLVTTADDGASTDDSATSASTAGTVASASSPVTAATTPATVSSQPTLQSELQALVTAKTLLKEGSTGASVGYVEQFMNDYFQTNSSIDNSFGPSLESQVKKFQSQNKISQTGQVAQSTFQMMVLWLKNNPQ